MRVQLNPFIISSSTEEGILWRILARVTYSDENTDFILFYLNLKLDIQRSKLLQIKQIANMLNLYVRI